MHTTSLCLGESFGFPCFLNVKDYADLMLLDARDHSLRPNDGSVSGISRVVFPTCAHLYGWISVW